MRLFEIVSITITKWNLKVYYQDIFSNPYKELIFKIRFENLIIFTDAVTAELYKDSHVRML